MNAALGRGVTWQAEALCRQFDPDTWFPDPSEVPENARRVCRLCPVRMECVTAAIASDEKYGVWGGFLARHLPRVARNGVALSIRQDDHRVDAADRWRAGVGERDRLRNQARRDAQ